MANDKPVGVGNNIGGVLTTLASSGDNWVKLLIVAGLFINTLWTKNNGKGISENSRELNAMRRSVVRQVRVIYDNQRVLAEYMDESRDDRDKVLTALNIPHPARTPYPRQEIPEYLTPNILPQGEEDYPQ